MSETETNEQKIPQETWNKMELNEDQHCELIVELINDSALKFKHYKQILEKIIPQLGCPFCGGRPHPKNVFVIESDEIRTRLIFRF